MRLLIILAMVSLLPACTTLSGGQRAATPSLDCMTAAIRGQVPGNVSDKRAHCIAAGLIARHCSTPEAFLASVGKEVKDLFGRGDAEWGDLKADRTGVACARRADGDAGLIQCCSTEVR